MTMDESLHAQLSRRESQIMNAVYRRGEATAEEVRSDLPDAPSNSAVRRHLDILEEKGHLQHRREGRRYVWHPTVPAGEAGRSALGHLVETFFGGSVEKAMSTLVGRSAFELSNEELKRLSALIEQAKQKDEKGRDAPGHLSSSEATSEDNDD